MRTGRAIVVDDLPSLSLQPRRQAIYDRDIGIRLLHIGHPPGRVPPFLRG